MKQAETPSISTERTYVLLRNALLTLMMAKPFEKITLTDICKLAMIPRSTFYRHFEDKYALLYHCFDNLLQDAELDLDIRVIQKRESAKHFFITLFCYLEKHKATYKKILASNRQGCVVECLRHYLERKIADDLLKTLGSKAPNGLPSDMFCRILASFILSAAQSFIESEVSYNIEELADRLSLCTNEGLLTI